MINTRDNTISFDGDELGSICLYRKERNPALYHRYRAKTKSVADNDNQPMVFAKAA